MIEISEQASPEDFRTLGLEPDAPLGAVKAAYIALVKVWHPDRYPKESPQKAEAEERLKTINAAYRRIQKSCHACRKKPSHSMAAQNDGGPMPGESCNYETASAAKQGEASISGRAGSSCFSKLWVAYSARKQDFYRCALVVSAIFLVIFWAKQPTISFWYEKLTFSPTVKRAPPVVVATQAPPKKASEKPIEQEALAGQKKSGLPGETGKTPSKQGNVIMEEGMAFFTLGSTPQEVLQIQGSPSKVQGNTWTYDLSSVTFREGKVRRYNNFDGTLKVRLFPSTDAFSHNSPVYFQLGSTKDHVLSIQGTPTAIENGKWYYAFSQISFREDQVIGFSNFSNNLKILMLPRTDTTIAALRGYFVLGSSQDDVLAVQGTPTSIHGNLWSYQLSTILFQDEKVRSVSDISGILLFLPSDMAFEKR